MSSNKFNSDNSNILINQIDICFLKQNASPSIPTQIESINSKFWSILIGLIKVQKEPFRGDRSKMVFGPVQ